MSKPMYIYVASSWRNAQQPEVVAQLRAAGFEVYDFRNPAPGATGFSWKKILPAPPPWSAEDTRAVLAHPISEEGFTLDFDAMKRADAFVMLQPCGRSAHLELGWACGAGKRTVALLADGQEPELMLKCADRIATSMEEVLAFLAEPPPDGQRWIDLRRFVALMELEMHMRAMVAGEALSYCNEVLPPELRCDSPSLAAARAVGHLTAERDLWVREHRETGERLAAANGRVTALEMELDALRGSDRR